MPEQEGFETYEVFIFRGNVTGALENIFSKIHLNSIDGGFGSDGVRVECQTLEGKTKVSVKARSRDKAVIAMDALTRYIEKGYGSEGLVIVNKRSGRYRTPKN